MTYQSVLADFKTMLSSCYSLNCIRDKEAHTTTDANGETTTTYSDNSAKNLLDDWIEEMDKIYNSIYSSILSLFIDPDDEDQIPDVNYQLLNGYADGSRSLEYYDKNKQEFIEKADYWFVRGNLYDMLPKANEGLYIDKYRSNVQRVVSICNNYEKLYASFPEPPTSSNDDGTTSTVTKVELFWNQHFSKFNEEVVSLLSGLLTEKNKFYELIQFTRDYRKVYEDVSEWISKGDGFVSALQKTSTGAGKCLGDSFSKVGRDGFAMYSPDMGTLYEWFVDAKRIRDASKYISEDDSNYYLRKIYTSEILLKFNFFNRSVNCLTWILNFRNHFDI